MPIGRAKLAGEKMQRWVAMVERTSRETGLIFEKYNVESGLIGNGGEYGLQTGFG